MSWSKHELEAIRKMPKKFVRDGTMIAAFKEDVFICHNEYAPMAYSTITKKVRRITFKTVKGAGSSGSVAFTRTEIST